MSYTGHKVFDGYFVYVVLADSLDGWLTVQLHGHRFRILKEDVTIC